MLQSLLANHADRADAVVVAKRRSEVRQTNVCSPAPRVSTLSFSPPSPIPPHPFLLHPLADRLRGWARTLTEQGERCTWWKSPLRTGSGTSSQVSLDSVPFYKNSLSWLLSGFPCRPRSSSFVAPSTHPPSSRLSYFSIRPVAFDHALPCCPPVHPTPFFSTCNSRCANTPEICYWPLYALFGLDMLATGLFAAVVVLCTCRCLCRCCCRGGAGGSGSAGATSKQKTS